MLTRHKLFLSVGHDEYWSGQQRSNVETARDSGLNLAFFSGNEVFWRIRWEEDFRTLVVYKESQEKVKKDPEVAEWTGTWRDGRPINPLGARPENSLTGTIFTVNAWRHDALEVPHRYAGLRFWRHTGVARLPGPGTKRLLKPGLLGHEWDEDLDNGHRPPGLVRLSETAVDNLWMIQDYGANYDSGSATHHLVMYRSVAGSLVFGAGTVQWSWGLDPHHDTVTGIPPDKANPTNIRLGVDQMGPEPDIQQATLNMFCDMGVKVGVTSLSPGLTMPEPSTDTSPPEVRCSFVHDITIHPRFLIIMPPLPPSPSVQVTGVEMRCDPDCRDETCDCWLEVAARDSEGVVAAVEFSIAQQPHSWHPAAPTARPAAWSLPLVRWRPQLPESLGYSFLADQEYGLAIRAVDDSYNIGPVHDVRIRTNCGRMILL